MKRHFDNCANTNILTSFSNGVVRITVNQHYRVSQETIPCISVTKFLANLESTAKKPKKKKKKKCRTNQKGRMNEKDITDIFQTQCCA